MISTATRYPSIDNVNLTAARLYGNWNELIGMQYVFNFQCNGDNLVPTGTYWLQVHVPA